MKTILVTGGAGFIGSNFVQFLYKNYKDHKIIVLDALTYAGRPENIPQEIHNDGKRFEFLRGDVCNGGLVDSLVGRSDIVVHFAAESHVARSIFDNKIFYETDVLGTQAVATAVVKHYQTVERFIHISTSEVYGTSEYEPMDEKHPLNPCSPYASAKCGADRLVYSFIHTYDMPAVILRPFNQYGPYQHLEKVISRFITSALSNEPLTIHGDGQAKRDWLYVEDTCQRIDLALRAPMERIRGDVFNIGSGEVLSVIDIAHMVLELTGRPKSLIAFIGDRPGQVQNHRSSTDKAEKVLGMRPGRPFREGLQQTIAWFKDNEEWWQKIEWMKHIKIMTKSGEYELH
ncbi:MAG TPA: GDP-mannose 4,6-dehydratase [Candidatus Omnitrophota bacterium]|nr:GDP-mannose 4,6-dehydratase [Candidatus Omnitrophota bacterium]HSA31385.1 GDP-mannose 4,6-dehydratase [Candidatus Omnitrophota bacterium]